MRSYIKKFHSEFIFLLLQTILYLAFLFLDLTGGSTLISSGIKYTIIILCFCYALLYGSAGKGIILNIGEVRKACCSLFYAGEVCRAHHSLFLQTAIFFTLVSDLFILLLDRYFYGVLTFIIVQQLYGLRLLLIREELDRKELDRKKAGKSRVNRSRHLSNIKVVRKAHRPLLYLFLKRLLVQLAVSAVICLILAGAGVAMEGLLAASVFYFIGILTNTVSAVRAALRNRSMCNNLLYAAGMLLFLLCDINVGLFNLSGFIAMPPELYSVIYGVSGVLMWTFYAPSQVLIALSSRDREAMAVR